MPEFIFSVQELSALFDDVAKESSAIIWIKNKDMSKQIYISPNFEQIWHQKTQSLYENDLNFWIETVHQDDQPTIERPLERRITANKDLVNDIMLFRVPHADGSVTFIRDVAFILEDNEGNPMLIAGIAYPISEMQWWEQRQKLILEESSREAAIEKVLFQIIAKTMKLQPQRIKKVESITPSSKILLPYRNHELKLSKRQAECLFYTLRGLTAKEIARLLNVSPRTIEYHIEEIKHKTNCKTKLELAGTFDLPLLEELLEKPK